MTQILSLQVSLFGSFEEISADAKLAADLIRVYDNKMLPSVIAIASLNARDGSISRVNRLCMISPDNELNLAFLPDRIDSSYTVQDKPLPAAAIEGKIEELCRILADAAQHFSAVGNRLAVNGRFVNTDAPHALPDYIHPRPFFTGKKLAEWSVSSNAPTFFPLGGAQEEVNNILGLSLTYSTQDEPGLLISFDINTAPSNRTPRFQAQSLHGFWEYAGQNLSEMLEGLR